jgi:hypothetical protein
MNRGVLLTALLAAGVLAGCTDTQYNVYILRNQVLTDGCTVSPSVTDFVSFGQLDVTDPIPGSNLVNTGYLLAAAVQNGTTGNVNDPNLHIFFAMGADVELRSNGSTGSDSVIAALGVRDLVNRTQYFAGSIPAGGVAGMGIPIIDSEQTEAIGEIIGTQVVQIIARSKVFGTIDGNSVTGDPFDFPVTVCKGCLFQDLGACSVVSMSDMMFSTGGTCNKLQDSLLDCCELDGGALQCPPVTMSGGTP